MSTCATYIIMPLEKKTVTTEANQTNRNSNECNLHAKWEFPCRHFWKIAQHRLEFVSVSVSVSGYLSARWICILLPVWLIMRPPFLSAICLWVGIHHRVIVCEYEAQPIWDLCHSTTQDEISPTIDPFPKFAFWGWGRQQQCVFRFSPQFFHSAKIGTKEKPSKNSNQQDDVCKLLWQWIRTRGNVSVLLLKYAHYKCTYRGMYIDLDSWALWKLHFA